MQKNIYILSMWIIQQRLLLANIHKDLTPEVFEKRIT